jgi:arylamine N-acetyltransferase
MVVTSYISYFKVLLSINIEGITTPNYDHLKTMHLKHHIAYSK